MDKGMGSMKKITQAVIATVFAAKRKDENIARRRSGPMYAYVPWYRFKKTKFHCLR